MLCLTRKKDERVMIGDDIEVVVLQIRGNKVKLGFQADPSVPVHRMENWLKIQQERNAADGESN